MGCTMRLIESQVPLFGEDPLTLINTAIAEHRPVARVAAARRRRLHHADALAVVAMISRAAGLTRTTVTWTAIGC